jgi:hypothetical protein
MKCSVGTCCQTSQDNFYLIHSERLDLRLSCFTGLDAVEWVI